MVDVEDASSLVNDKRIERIGNLTKAVFAHTGNGVDRLVVGSGGKNSLSPMRKSTETLSASARFLSAAERNWRTRPVSMREIVACDTPDMVDNPF